MSIHIDRRLPGALLLIGAFLAPLSAGAQVTEPDAHALANHRHALAMTAAEFVTSREAMPLIARLHSEAAVLRDATDPKAYECWRLQAALLHAIDDHEGAHFYMKAAAEVALFQGDPGLAAHAFLDAAGSLNEQGQMAQAQLLIQRAHNLTAHPELNGSELRGIQRRIQIR